MKIIYIILASFILILGMSSCKEDCVFYVQIYENGSPITTLGPFGNEDAATDEANDYINNMSDGNYSYKVELKTDSNCKESEE